MFTKRMLLFSFVICVFVFMLSCVNNPVNLPQISFKDDVKNKMIIDNFEDGDKISRIFCSDCINEIDFNITSDAMIILGGVAPGQNNISGRYYFSVTGTIKENLDSQICIIINCFMEKNTDTGINLAEYKTLKLDYKLKSDNNIKMVMFITNSRDNKSARADSELINDNTWHNISKTVSNTCPLSGPVIPNLTQIYICLRPDTLSSSDRDIYFEFCIDNILFEK